MNKVLVVAVLALLTSAKASSQTNPAVNQANRVAQRMTDSLSLNSVQKDSIYSISLRLNNQKMGVRQQYAGSDSLVLKLQLTESRRDSLYRPILTDQQYQQYIQRKLSILGN